MDLCLMVEGQEGVAWPDWVALAGACERHGIPALLRSDHYMNLADHPDRGSLDAWATICGLAAVTSTLRLGTLVSPATFRHPSNLARVVVTADHISGGRVELGLGAGWHEREHAANGFEFPGLRDRMDILEEQLQVILGHWSGEPFTFAGKHYRLGELEALPQPVQAPHPRIILGGGAGPRAAALAGRYADEYNTLTASLEEFSERRARLAEACARAGRDPIPLSVMVMVITGADRTELVERAERVARIRRMSTDAVLKGPGPAWLVGPIPEVLERLAVLRDAGANRVICQKFDHEDLEFVELIAKELAPQLA